MRTVRPERARSRSRHGPGVATSAPKAGSVGAGSLGSTMAHEFIYQAYKLARHYPPDKTVLENISLSFYPGAKIGVLGSNGAGKSSLLKIMAGLDDGYSGRGPAHRRVHRRLSRPGAAARSRPRTSRAT